MLSEGYPVYQKCETFYEALSVFLQDGENARFNRDVIFDRDGNTIKVRHCLSLSNSILCAFAPPGHYYS